MAKSLQPLVRLHGWQVDEKRRRLGELLRIVESLEARLTQLHEELAREQAAAAASPELAGVIYGNYARAVIETRAKLTASIEQAEQAVASARDELREAYREQKKFEMTQKARDKREEKERSRLEQIDLDEVGLEVFRQKSRRLV
jgi:flagellar export protein FliJ